MIFLQHFKHVPNKLANIAKYSWMFTLKTFHHTYHQGTLRANAQSPLTPMQMKRMTSPELTLDGPSHGAALRWKSERRYQGSEEKKIEPPKNNLDGIWVTDKLLLHLLLQGQLPGVQSQKRCHPLSHLHGTVCCVCRSVTSL